MTKKLYEESNIQGIADGIRYVNGGTDKYTTENMEAAIRALKKIFQEKTAMENGIVLPDAGYDGLSRVTVQVPDTPAEPVLQEKTAIENGIVLPDTGYDGLSKVIVNVSGGGSSPIEVAHIWTKSTGNSNASMWVQTPEQSEPVAVLYTSVNTNADPGYALEFDGIILGYLTYGHSTPDKNHNHSGWAIIPASNVDLHVFGIASDNSSIAGQWDSIADWSYIKTVNIYLYKNW